MSGLEGTTLGHYRLKHLLGKGGMSEVYLAFDEHEHSDVAVKVIHKDQSEHVERLQREVIAMRVFTHDHILPALDAGQDDAWHYLVMPYLAHGTLRERLRMQGPLTMEEAGVILEQVASALQYAHERGILHRDIKSANILFRDKQYVYLADFGLAKVVEERSDITRSGYVMGTVEYMAPELAEEPASTRSDIYALSILLYEMVTGNVPCDHLIQQNAQGIDIAPRAGRLFRQFRSHILDGSHHVTASRDIAPLFHHFCQSKVREIDILLVTEQNIGRFDVTMENAPFMCILQGARYLFEDDTGFFHCQRPLHPQSFAKRTVCEIWHDQIMPGIVLACIESR